MLNTLSKTCNFEIIRIGRNWSVDAVFIEDFIKIVFNNFQLIKYKCLINCSTGRTPLREIDGVLGPTRILMWRRNTRNNFRISKAYCFSAILFPFIPNNIGFSWNPVWLAGRWLSEKLGSTTSDFWLAFKWLSFIRLLWRGLIRKMILWFFLHFTLIIHKILRLIYDNQNY